MPTYVYACESCNNRFEKYQSFNDSPLSTCIACGEEGKVRRVIQPAGVLFKGAGWYITDSRGGSSAALSSDSGAKDSKSEPPASTSSASAEA